MKRLDTARLNMFRTGVAKRVRRIWDATAQESVEARFQTIWRSVTRSPLLRAACPRVHGIIRYRFFDYAYAEIVDRIHAHCGRYIALPVHWDDPALLERIAQTPGASIIVSRHFGFAYTLRSLARADRGFAAVAGFPHLMELHYRRSGIETMPNVELIPTDNKCLVRLLGAARNGKIITCQPDAIDPATGALDFINLYFFEFARRLRVPMYFAKQAMTASGTLQGVIAGPIESRDARDAAHRFIEFSRPEMSFRIHSMHGAAAANG